MAAAKGGEAAKKGSGKRRRYRGKMVLPSGSPRASTHGGHSPASAGWECGAPPGDSKVIPGRYRVPAPTKAWQRHGIYGSVS